jgi:hypothetical protein
MAAACLSGGVALAGPAAASGWHLAAISPPTGSPASLLSTVSCTGAAACVAGGMYGQEAPEEGEYPYMTVAGSGGAWAKAETGPLPADSNSFTTVNVNSIACPAAGFCVAVGSYLAQGTTPADQASPPFIATEKHGRWVSAVRVSLPAGAATPAGGNLLSVTCTGPAACLAIGSYGDAKGQGRLMSVVGTHGSWGKAKQITLPGKASLEDLTSLNSLSCTSSTACIAVGKRLSGSAFVAAAAVLSGGRWAWAPALKVPRGAESVLSSVSCAHGQCVAVGWYGTDGSRVPMFAIFSRGRWSAVKPLPARVAGTPRGEIGLDAVSCTASFCLAAGTDHNLPAASTAWFAVRIARGGWRSASVIKVPRGVSGNFSQITTVGGVSCTRAGFCAIAGSFTNLHGDQQALVATEG